MAAKYGVKHKLKRKKKIPLKYVPYGQLPSRPSHYSDKSGDFYEQNVTDYEKREAANLRRRLRDLPGYDILFGVKKKGRNKKL